MDIHITDSPCRHPKVTQCWKSTLLQQNFLIRLNMRKKITEEKKQTYDQRGLRNIWSNSSASLVRKLRFTKPQNLPRIRAGSRTQISFARISQGNSKGHHHQHHQQPQQPLLLTIPFTLLYFFFHSIYYLQINYLTTYLWFFFFCLLYYSTKK